MVDVEAGAGAAPVVDRAWGGADVRGDLGRVFDFGIAIARPIARIVMLRFGGG